MNKKYYINSPTNSIPKDLTSAILQKHNAMEFHKTLQEYKPTPLIQLPNLAKKYNVGNIYVKDESFRFGLNAFKVLGASCSVSNSLINKVNKTPTNMKAATIINTACQLI